LILFPRFRWPHAAALCGYRCPSFPAVFQDSFPCVCSPGFFRGSFEDGNFGLRDRIVREADWGSYSNGKPGWGSIRKFDVGQGRYGTNRTVTDSPLRGWEQIGGEGMQITLSKLTSPVRSLAAGTWLALLTTLTLCLGASSAMARPPSPPIVVTGPSVTIGDLNFGGATG